MSDWTPAATEHCCGTCRHRDGDRCRAGKVEWIGAPWWGSACLSWSDVRAPEHVSGPMGRAVAALKGEG